MQKVLGKLLFHCHSSIIIVIIVIIIMLTTVFRLSKCGDNQCIQRTVHRRWRVDMCVWRLPWAVLRVDWQWWKGRVD